jgi:hypothetical protein
MWTSGKLSIMGIGPLLISIISKLLSRLTRGCLIIYNIEPWVVKFSISYCIITDSIVFEFIDSLFPPNVYQLSTSLNISQFELVFVIGISSHKNIVTNISIVLIFKCLLTSLGIKPTVWYFAIYTNLRIFRKQNIGHQSNTQLLIVRFTHRGRLDPHAVQYG